MPTLALILCVSFILWLFVRDRKLRPMTSGALWIALSWILIVGTRPISVWLGGGTQFTSTEEYLDGSPLDRNVFIILIVAALLVLLRRRIDWSKIIASNRWFFAFSIYCGISILWSDYSFVGFKRWIKDLGNVLMILIILTEQDPILATKAVFLRVTYILIPLSFLFIKYFPDLGRYYNPWTWELSFCGVTTNKNELGAALFVCGLFIVWDLIDMRTTGRIKTEKTDLLSRIVLFLMLFWLTSKAHSSTSLVCLILGTSIILFARHPFARRQIEHLRAYCLLAGFLVLILYSVPSLLESLVMLVGRDATFTGRTDLWSDLLKEPVNPLLGTGYKSFWLGPGAEHMWAIYSFHPIQAHNGYIQTYLDTGAIGLFMLMAMIIAAGSNLKKELLSGNNYGILRFAFLVVAIFYNWTEAMFNGLNLVWLVLLIAALNYPQRQLSTAAAMVVVEFSSKASPKRKSMMPLTARQNIDHNISIK